MKPSGDCFDGAMRERSRVVVTGRGAIDDMIRNRHYLRSWPGVVMACFALLVDDVPRGACVYALPPRETNARYGGYGWELARLWVDDGMPTNTETWFVAQTIKEIRRQHPEVMYLVSYADPSAGHEGLIYRAGNWVNDGRTNDGRKTPKFDHVADMGADLFGVEREKRFSRRAHVPAGTATRRLHRSNKFRFVYRLGRRRRHEA